MAGLGQIQTFLAQLSRISSASGVLISLYELVSEVSDSGSNLDQQTKGEDRAAVGVDPLQALGYVNSSLSLRCMGLIRDCCSS